MTGPSPLDVQRARAAATAAVLAFGVASALHFVGAEHLALRGGSVQPLGHDDYPLLYRYGRLGARFLAERGATYGYDPSFLAGSVKMPLYYPSSKPFELTLWLFAGADPAAVFNRTVFAMIASLPLLAWLAAGAFGLAPVERVVVAALASVPHALVPMAGIYSFLEASGTISFVFASSLSLLVVALFARTVRGGGAGSYAALLVLAPLLFGAHPSAGLLVALPVSLLYASRLRHLSWRRHAALLGVAAACLLLNAVWLRGLWLYGHYGALDEFYSPGGRSHLAPIDPLWSLRMAPSALGLIPPLGGAAGLWLWWRGGQRERLLVFGPQLALLFGLTYYSGPLGLAALSPARLTVPLGLYLLFPAAHACVAAVTGAWRAAARVEPAARRGALRAGGVALLAGALVLAAARTPLLRYYALPGLQRESGYRDHAQGLFAFLREHTHPGARLLHEETDRLAHRYWGSHLAALIPLETGLLLAGGPAPYPLLRHDHLRFIAGTLRRRLLTQIPPAAMARQLSLYNVGWVLCWSGIAKRYFDAFPEAERVGRYETLTLYSIAGPKPWFLAGAGTLAVRDGRIELSELVPEQGRVTLKFHWLEGLRSDPPRRLEPVPVADDPVPFLSILDPPERLVVYDAS